MTSKLLPKKSFHLTIVISIIVALLASSSVFSILLVYNYQKESISSEEAIQIANSIPEIALFLEENENLSITTNLVNSKWIVEYFFDLLNYLEDEFNWMNYGFVEIDAQSGAILYYIINNPNEPVNTESSVLALAEANYEIIFWKELYRYVYPTIWFDGYEFWYVNYLHNETDSSALVIISDQNFTIIHVEIYCRFPGASHSLQEIFEITNEHPTVIAWKENNPEYRISGIFKQNRWRVNYGSDYNIVEETSDWLYLLVNDTTLEIFLVKYRLWGPIHSEQEAIDIALADAEVAYYLSTFNYTISIDWSDMGYWEIYFRHEYIKGKELFVTFDDHLGEIISIEFYNLTDPVMTYQEAFDFAMNITEVDDWLTLGFDYITSLYYYYNEFYDGGLWAFKIAVDTYHNETPIYFDPDDIIGYFIQFDDLTQEIVYMIMWLGDGTEEFLIDEIS
jgi:hypothetical protein